MANWRRADTPHLTRWTALGGALSLGLAGHAAAFAQEESCTHVTTQSLALPGLIIDGSKMQEAGNGLPKHCIVSGAANDRTGVDGKHYAIRFEIRLPADWNGRFLSQENGGGDGAVEAATGDGPGALASGGRSALARGFAVLSSDAGHSGQDPANKELGLAAGAAFGLDPQARRDYGYSADVTLAPIAKAIIAAHYGRKPDYSYMMGCSNGGRHAMVAATRMPEAYDGFLVGDPGFDLPRAAIQHAWDAQALVRADPDIRKSITEEDAAFVSRRIIAACDKLDGLEDGLTANLAACQKAFSFDSLTCAPGTTGDCLPKAKVEALKMSFAGPRNAKGEALYSDWPVDGGVGTGNWRLWKVESPIPPWDHYPIIATMGASSLQYIFTTPPTEVAGSTDALMKSLLAFDFDRDAPKIYAKNGRFSSVGDGIHDAARRRQSETRAIPPIGPQNDHLSRPGGPGLLDRRHDPLVRKAQRQSRRQGRSRGPPVRGSRHDPLQRRRHARQVRRSDHTRRLGRKGQGTGPDHRHCRSGEQGNPRFLERETLPPALPVAEICALQERRS